MNQEKIGKFIRDRRLSKKMTQQELALKLGVSDKAISKWENGRCLMDLSLLKPLSEILEVSIVEILSGERLENDDIFVKSNEVVENTLDYSKEEIRKNKIKIIASVCIFIFVILISIYFCYKGFNLYRYSTSEWVNKEIKNPYNFDKVYKIYKKTIPEEEYLVIKNIKIKNITNDLYLNEDTFLDSTKMYNSTYYNIENDNLFDFSMHIEYMETMKNTSAFDSFNQHYDVSFLSFFLEEDINDTIDLFYYFYENGYKYNNIFTSVENMKLNRAYNRSLDQIGHYDVNYKYLISGDYKGMIYEHKNVNRISVWLVKNGVEYFFTFGGEYANLDYVLDIISTIEIR